MREVQQKLADLQAQFNENTAKKEQLERDVDMCSKKLDRYILVRVHVPNFFQFVYACIVHEPTGLERHGDALQKARLVPLFSPCACKKHDACVCGTVYELTGGYYSMSLIDSVLICVVELRS